MLALTYSTDEDAILAGDEPQWTATCECGGTVARYRGDMDVSCPRCHATYNSGGQRLRDDWAENASWRDEDIDDMEGFEQAALRREAGL